MQAEPQDPATEDQAVDTEPESTVTDAAGADHDVQPEHRGDDEPDTFPRHHVEDLRRENARYRQRAQKADSYAQRLHTELVRATGRLARPDRHRVQRGTPR